MLLGTAYNNSYYKYIISRSETEMCERAYTKVETKRLELRERECWGGS